MTVTNRWRKLLAFSSIYLLWGSTYLAIRYAIESFPPYGMMGVRSLIAGAVLFVWGRRQSTEELTFAHWRSAFILGAFFFLGAHGFLAWAERRIPSGVASLLVATIPGWLALYEIYIGRIRFTSRLALGLILGFVGVLLLTDPSQLLPGESMDLLAASAVLVGSMSWTTGTLLSRRLPLPQNLILFSGMNLLGGGVLLCTVSLLWGETFPSQAISMRSIAGVLYLIVAGSVIGFVAYMWLLKVETASKVGTYAFVNPAIAVFLGWLGGGEALSGRILGATALMVTGVAILVTGKEESRPARASVPRAAAVRETV
jgi:drug/metabolite transporter (DMT)-like permease